MQSVSSLSVLQAASVAPSVGKAERKVGKMKGRWGRLEERTDSFVDDDDLRRCSVTVESDPLATHLGKGFRAAPGIGVQPSCFQ